MGNTIKRQHQPAFKVKVVLEMLAGVKTVSQICSEYSIHPTQAQTWKAHALGFVENSFTGQSFTNQIRQKDEFIEELYKQIGKLKYEVDWLKKKMGIASI
jgi:transposase-like protein